MKGSRRRGFRALALGLGIAVFLFLDWGVRHIYLQFRPQTDKSFSHRTQHPFYDHGFHPMTRGMDHYGPLSAEVSVNSLGLRDEVCREVVLRPDEPRLLLLGDSFVEAGCLPWASTFAGILQKYGQAHGVDVQNGGVASYCAATYNAKLRFLVDHQRARIDGVLLFLDVSDVRDELSFERVADGSIRLLPTGPFTGETAQRLLRARKFEDLYRWLNRHIENHFVLLGALVRNSWILLKEHYSLSSVREVHQTYFDLLSWAEKPGQHPLLREEALRRTRESLDALHEFCRARGIVLTMVVYPWPDQIRIRDRETPAWTTWRDWCAAKEIPLISLFQPFWDAGPAEAVIQRFYIPGDMHWNEAGHQFVAQQIIRHWPELQGRLAPGRPTRSP